MKNLFKAITAQLDAIPRIKWVDEEKGQMNYNPSLERPPLLFPAALVTISLPNTQNYNQSKQQAQAQVRIQLCFDFTGNTNTKTPAADRDRSLAYYDVVDEVYQALQGFSTSEFNELERRNFSHLLRPDQYKTVVITFVTDFLED